MTKSYSEMMEFEDFNSRLDYLNLFDGNHLSPRDSPETMRFFKSHSWKTIRKQIINRDLGFDLGVFGVYIDGKVLVHHINPISIEDIEQQSEKLLDPENLITVSIDTHNRIHYGIVEELPERRPGDTIMW